MRMDKLTTKFQQALQDAQSFAVGKDHQFIEPVHLMNALLEQEISQLSRLGTRRILAGRLDFMSRCHLLPPRFTQKTRSPVARGQAGQRGRRSFQAHRDGL